MLAKGDKLVDADVAKQMAALLKQMQVGVGGGWVGEGPPGFGVGWGRWWPLGGGVAGGGAWPRGGGCIRGHPEPSETPQPCCAQ